ncbi:AlbA family DNA-binding domain-containing protein [Crocinitomix algicola]|uniref:AlbA family DNA-binding domain-containing protein n=1 Tax=Crocinitomix algicola TaxID=1740263 RepID=UPI0009F3C888|nr:ATP-binding protein [Crocinitomix algicola]
MNEMLTKNKFLEIVESPKSSVLHFKKDVYDFVNDRHFVNTAKMVKDIISLANTIRNETAYIIYGVAEKTETSLKLIGIENEVTNELLQEKIKNKVFPRPVFSYHEIEFNNLRFGVLELPVHKYEAPLTSRIHLKGLARAKVYYRSGKNKVKACGSDVIRINEWLKSLPGSVNETLSDKVNEIILRLTKNEEKLSIILTDLLELSKKYLLRDIGEFCTSQILGVKENMAEKHKYRVQKVIVSASRNEMSFVQYDKIIKSINNQEQINVKDFEERYLLINHSIITVEHLIEQFNNRKNKLYELIQLNSQYNIQEDSEELNIFVFESNIDSLYRNIQQKTIDLLMKI